VSARSNFALALIFIFFQTLCAHAENCERDNELFHLATSLYDEKQFLISSIHFSEISASSCDLKLASRARFAFALCMIELGERESALNALDTTETKRALLLKGYLGVISTDISPSDKIRLFLWDHRFESEIFKNALKDNQLPVHDLERIQAKIIETRNKNPALAGVMSAVLPGAGQAYTGAWQSAALALIINGLFTAATLDFANKNMYGATAASSVVLSITYVGNILNAVNSAKQVNNVKSGPSEVELKNTLFPEFKP